MAPSLFRLPQVYPGLQMTLLLQIGALCTVGPMQRKWLTHEELVLSPQRGLPVQGFQRIPVVTTSIIVIIAMLHGKVARAAAHLEGAKLRYLIRQAFGPK